MLWLSCSLIGDTPSGEPTYSKIDLESHLEVATVLEKLLDSWSEE
ncbi:hypothetical protein ES703_73467 [subsurface metagenome]